MSEAITKSEGKDPTAARLAEINARLEQIELARSEKEQAQRLAVAERALADAELIEKAEAEHGELKKMIDAVRTPIGVVIVKRPNHVVFRRFIDEGKVTTTALEKLVRHALVHPTLPQFESMLEELPAVLLDCANAVSRLAGIRSEETAGK